MDLVGTCPKGFWQEWINEGDPAGTDWSGEEWGWYTGHTLAAEIRVGERFYIVAWGRLRGWAPVTKVERDAGGGWIICRGGNATACTIEKPIQGFRGLEKRWWNYEDELPFPTWQTEGIDLRPKGKKAAIAAPSLFND